ncbi:hypothetical protein [Roseateles sp.]|uniref:hypothetical protein n=1 Tax=Roseateles sp. TaxID=1971397 RepID=UPI003266A5A5
MTDAERARRDADKVFSFIKFQTVKIKPAAEPVDMLRKPAPPNPQRPASTPLHAEAAAAASATTTGVATPTAEATAAGPAQTVAGAVASFGKPAGDGRSAALATEAEAEPETTNNDEVALQILQWQFAPLPHSRLVDVEVAFRRD